MASYFVVAAGQKTGGSEIVLSCAVSPAQAHGFAADEYRRKRNIPSNIHVDTSTLGRFESELQAIDFVDRLFEEMEKKNNDSQHSNSQRLEDGEEQFT